MPVQRVSRARSRLFGFLINSSPSTVTDPELLEQCFAELSHADAEHRDRIRFLIERKVGSSRIDYMGELSARLTAFDDVQNAMTKYFLQEMQKISALQSDVANMPTELAALDHDLGCVNAINGSATEQGADLLRRRCFRTRTDNFKHLSRLEGLIPAYVATVAEVIRRREYGELSARRTLTAASVDLSLTSAQLVSSRNIPATSPRYIVHSLSSNASDGLIIARPTPASSRGKCVACQARRASGYRRWLWRWSEQRKVFQTSVPPLWTVSGLSSRTGHFGFALNFVHSSRRARIDALAHRRSYGSSGQHRHPCAASATTRQGLGRRDREPTRRVCEIITRYGMSSRSVYDEKRD